MRTTLQAAGGFLAVATVFHAGAMLAVGGLSITVIGMAGAAAILLVTLVSQAEW